MQSIIVLGAGIMQISAIKIAKEMDLYTIAADKNPEAIGFQFADLALAIDTKNTKELIKFATENKERYNIKGVFAAADNATSAAAINKNLNLIGVSEFSAIYSNNKWLSKQIWLSNNIPTPFAKEVRNYKEAHDVIDKIGLPCMVKAIDSSASRGTKKIENIDELSQALSDAFNHSSTKSALIEEFVEGEEFSIETVIYNKKQYRFGIAKREFDMKPLPIETGHINPAILDETTTKKMYEIALMAAQALKIDNAPAKADMIISKEGKIMILEIAARLSGGFHSQYTTPLSSGMNPIKFTMQLTIGETPDKDTYTPKFKRFAICRSLFPPPGVIEKIEGTKEALKIEGVNEIFMLAKEGDLIKPYENCADRICYCLVSANDLDSANKIFEHVKNKIKFQIRNYI